MGEKFAEYEEKISQLPESIEKLARINTYVQKVEFQDPQKAAAILDDAIRLGEKLLKTDELASEHLLESYFALAKIHFHNGSYAQVITSVYRSLPIFMKYRHDLLHGRALNMLASANFHLGNTEEGFQFSWQAMEIFERVQDDYWIAAVDNNLGFQYLTMEHYEWAERYFFQALERISRKNHIEKAKAEIYNNLCQLYTETNQHPKALDYGQKALSLFRKTNLPYGQSDVLINLGSVHHAMQQTKLAKRSIKEAIEITQKYSLRYQEIKALIRFGEIAASENEIELGLIYLQRALSQAEILNAKHSIYKIHHQLSKVYKQRTEYALALDHFELFHKLEKQVLNDKENQRIKSMEIMHQVDSARKSAEQYRVKNYALEEQLDKEYQVQKDLQKLALTDPLTGLFNRRHFNDTMQNMFKDTGSLNQQKAMLVLDIDHFKQVNDQYGHLVGDQVLIQIADLMRLELRERDLIWRVGGEEFAILLPNTSCEQAQMVAERIRAGAEQNTFTADEFELKLTVSLGVSCNTDFPHSLDAMFALADQALYQAKTGGRNQVVVRAH